MKQVNPEVQQFHFLDREIHSGCDSEFAVGLGLNPLAVELLQLLQLHSAEQSWILHGGHGVRPSWGDAREGLYRSTGRFVLGTGRLTKGSLLSQNGYGTRYEYIGMTLNLYFQFFLPID